MLRAYRHWFGLLKEGYTFLGWSTTANGSATYKQGASYTMPAHDVTLYAVWQINDIVIYDEDNNIRLTNYISVGGNEIGLWEQGSDDCPTDSSMESVAFELKNLSGFKTVEIYYYVECSSNYGEDRVWIRSSLSGTEETTLATDDWGSDGSITYTLNGSTSMSVWIGAYTCNKSSNTSWWSHAWIRAYKVVLHV